MIMEQNGHPNRRNKQNCDDMPFPGPVAELLVTAEQEIQPDWEVYAKYKRQLNDIPLDPRSHMEIVRRLAEIFGL